MLSQLMAWMNREEGQGMAEYGLIIALVAVVVIAALTLLGTNLTAIFNSIATTVGS
jgi:pilus assembly protein Flp/PilA